MEIILGVLALFLSVASIIVSVLAITAARRTAATYGDVAATREMIEHLEDTNKRERQAALLALICECRRISGLADHDSDIKALLGGSAMIPMPTDALEVAFLRPHGPLVDTACPLDADLLAQIDSYLLAAVSINARIEEYLALVAGGDAHLTNLARKDLKRKVANGAERIPAIVTKIEQALQAMLDQHE